MTGRECSAIWRKPGDLLRCAHRDIAQKKHEARRRNSNMDACLYGALSKEAQTDDI